MKEQGSVQYGRIGTLQEALLVFVGSRELDVYVETLLFHTVEPNRNVLFQTSFWLWKSPVTARPLYLVTSTQFWSISNLIMIHHTLADPRGTTHARLGIQMLSFSPSFRHKNCKNNRLAHPLWELAPPSGKTWTRPCHNYCSQNWTPTYSLQLKLCVTPSLSGGCIVKLMTLFFGLFTQTN